MLLVEQIRLNTLELQAISKITAALTGDIETDRDKYAEIVGNLAGQAWREGIECGLAAKKKTFKNHKMPARIVGNIDGRIALTFKEASGIFAIRMKYRTGKQDQEKYVSEYAKALNLGARAAIQDAANAGLIYARGL